MNGVSNDLQQRYIIFKSETLATKAINRINIKHQNVFDFIKSDTIQSPEIMQALSENHVTLSNPIHDQNLTTLNTTTLASNKPSATARNKSTLPPVIPSKTYVTVEQELQET